jgi:putative hydrolase of the HAD superfamily
MSVEAVIWDFGGVLTSSPFDGFASYEHEHGLPTGCLRRINATNPDGNAWALLERGEIDVAEFDVMFSREARAMGHEVRGVALLPLLSGEIRPPMGAALALCRRHFRVGCITNNMLGAGQGPDMAVDLDHADKIATIMDMFEVVIESAKIGLRKPDPRIYQLMCDRLGVAPKSCVILMIWQLTANPPPNWA